MPDGRLRLGLPDCVRVRVLGEKDGRPRGDPRPGMRGKGRRNEREERRGTMNERAKSRQMTLASLVFGAAVFMAGYVLRERATPLTLGTHAEFPPFEYREEPGGRIVGFDLELARAVAEKAGRPLRVVDMPFEDLIPALEAGEVDFVMVAMTITPERAKRVDFSRPYYRATQVAMVRAGDPEPAAKEELEDKRIGAQSGTTSYAWAREIAGAANAKGVPTARAAAMALANGEVDCIFVDEQPAEALGKTFPGLKIVRIPFEVEEYGAAVRKGNRALLETIDRTLEELVADGRHEWFVDRWMVMPQ